MHKNKTVMLLTICTLLVSNWGLASIDAGLPSAGHPYEDVLLQPSSSQVRDPVPGAAAMLLAQVGDLLRDTIRRQIRQRLETGEFDDSDLEDDNDDQGGDDVSNDEGNDNSSPDDVSEDDDSSPDDSDDTSQDNDDEASEDDGDNRGRGRGRVNRGPRGSFDSQF